MQPCILRPKSQLQNSGRIRCNASSRLFLGRNKVHGSAMCRNFSTKSRLAQKATQSHFEAVFGAKQGAWFLHVLQFWRKKRPKWGSRLPFTTVAIGSNIRNPILASFATKILPYRGLGSGILRALKAYDNIKFIDDREGNTFKAIIAL